MLAMVYRRTVHQFQLQHHQAHTIHQHRDNNQLLLFNRQRSKSTLVMDHMVVRWTDRCAVQIQVSIFGWALLSFKTKIIIYWIQLEYLIHSHCRLLPELWSAATTTTATTKFPTKYVATTIEWSIQFGSSNGYRRNKDVITVARHVRWTINTVSQQQRQQ